MQFLIKSTLHAQRLIFNAIKAKILKHLERLEKEEAEGVQKAFSELTGLMIKGGKGLPVGTIREWKGKKFIKVAPGKWKPKYEAVTRGARMSVAAIKRKVIACDDAHDMMQIMIDNKDRFSDEHGEPLRCVQELSDFIDQTKESKAAEWKKREEKEKKEAEKQAKKEAREKQKREKEEAKRQKQEEAAARKQKKAEEKGSASSGDDGNDKNKKSYTKTLRTKLKKNLQAQIGLHKNKKTGIEARLSGSSIDKIGSDKAIEKSKNNGFTVDDHFAIANKIVELYTNADLVEVSPDKRNSPDLKSIKRFDSAVELQNGQKATAHITVKESVQNGHKIYSVEVMELQKRTHSNNAMGDGVNSNAPHSANSGNNQQSHGADKQPPQGGRLIPAETPPNQGTATTEATSTVPQSEKKAKSGIEKIKAQYMAKRQITGDEDEIYVGDKTFTGTWKLVEANAPSASHNEKNFRKTEGFPENTDGSTINDRDYENDRAAQEAVISVASKYDGRALSFDTPVVVTQDGVVVSGNNRTMSSKLAADNGTDSAYIEALKKRAKKFGFTSEDLSGFKHPRVVFEIQSDGNYSTEQFAQFNVSETKTMNPIEQAVKISKIVKTETVKDIAAVIADFETMGEVYADKKAASGIFDTLQKAGLINQFTRPQYENDGVITGAGKEFLETVLIGSVVNEKNIRGLNREGCKSIRRKLVRAIAPLVNNKSMGGYAVTDELNAAIDVMMQVNIAKDKFKSVDDFAAQGNMFEGKNTVAIELAKKLEGKEKDFAEFMQSMNAALEPGASGQVDIFFGGIETKDDVLKRMLNLKKSLAEAVSGAVEQLRLFYRAQAVERIQKKLGLETSFSNFRDQKWTEKSLTYSGYPLEGRTKIHGMDISIENKKGSVRSGVDKDGHKWSIKMAYDYGYIRGTVGKDKDHIDVYVGNNPDSKRVFIVHQNDPTSGKYDEDKVMLGFNSAKEAHTAYLRQYDRPGFFGEMIEMNIDEFKEKAFDKKKRGKMIV